MSQIDNKNLNLIKNAKGNVTYMKIRAKSICQSIYLTAD